MLDSAQEVGPESWAPDGKTLLYLTEDERRPRGRRSVWALGPGPEAKPELVFRNGFNLDEPQASPDGRWLAYVSDESDQWEVYVRPFRRPGEPVRVSVNGGGQPKWRRDGRELFYLAADGRLMSVPVTGTGAAFEVGLPAVLFDTGGYRPSYDDYAPSADGQRFLVKVAPEGRSAQMHVVLNWPSLIPAAR
jgi:Tol biopolymer transport system component